MTRRWLNGLLGALALLLPQPLMAGAKDVPGSADSEAEIADLRASLAALQADDTRLLTIGWRLASANAAFCADSSPSIGLLPLDARTFRKPADIRTALGLTGEFAVQAVATGSPAAGAQLKPGEELLTIKGLPFAELPDVPAGSFSRLAALQTRIDALLATKGELDLEIAQPGSAPREVVLHAVSACRSRFELLTDGNEAAADGDRIIISRRFLALARTDDEAAFFIGHELAHNVLRHRALLDKIGRSNKNVRQAERAADRLALWLMANAGYDTARATEFMERWGKQQANLVFHNPTHDHWKARLALLVAEVPKIEALRGTRNAAVDWRPFFPR